KNLVDGYRSAHLEHELDHFRGFHRHLRSKIGHGDGFADGNITHNRTARALEAVLITLLQPALATSATTKAIAFFVESTRCDTWRRGLVLGSRTRLRNLALTPIIHHFAFFNTTRLFFLTHFTGSWSSCFAHHRATRLSLGSYRSFCARGRLLAGSF